MLEHLSQKLRYFKMLCPVIMFWTAVGPTLYCPWRPPAQTGCCVHCPSLCRSGVYLHRGLVPRQTSAAADQRPVLSALWRPSIPDQQTPVQWPRLRRTRCRPGECLPLTPDQWRRPFTGWQGGGLLFACRTPSRCVSPAASPSCWPGVWSGSLWLTRWRLCSGVSSRLLIGWRGLNRCSPSRPHCTTWARSSAHLSCVSTR